MRHSWAHRERLPLLAALVLGACSPAASIGPGPTATGAPATGAPTAVASAPSPPPSAIPDESDEAITKWAHIPLRAALGGGSLLSLTRFGDGFLGVGVESASAGDRAAGWSSRDGVAWTRVGTIDDSGRASIYGVAASADAVLVATGYDEQGPTAWSSSDGITWSQAELPSSVPLSGVRVDAIAAGPSGFLVLGHDTIDNGLPPNAFFPPAPPMWHSQDGRHWTSVSLPDEGVRVGVQVWSLAARSSGFIAGGARLVGQRRLPAVWTSEDGLAWSRAIELPGGTSAVSGEDLFINPVAVGPERTLAVSGRLNDETLGRIWSSADGATWKAVTDLGPDDGQMRVLGWTPGGFVAASLVGDEPDRQTLVISSPADGTSWRQLFTFPEPLGQLPTAVATDGVRVVIQAGTQDILVGPTLP